MQNKIQFPKDFLWGTSTSAYQIEGGTKNDWSEWEVSPKRKAQLKKAPSSECQNKNSEDYICGEACHSYFKYEEDFDLAKALNTNAIRIGIEWARINPKKDLIDVKAIRHYHKVLDATHARGLKVVLTLWHWTNPTWIAEEEGWTNRKTVDHFLKYVELITQEFGGRVDYWITLNEPMLFANYSYFLGKFPPQKHNWFKFKKATKNLIEAHKRSYEIIHKHFPNTKVSITNLSNIFEAKRKWFLPEIILCYIAKNYGLNKFIEKIKDYIDYIGIDYYRKIYLKTIPPFMDTKSKILTDNKWEIYPRGIYELIMHFNKYKKPILILENGLADKDDKHREKFIKDHLFFIHKAMQEGADVRGYFHWSLLDNFEWAEGWDPKFGLFEVDRKTFERKARPSAKAYAEICEDGGFDY
jgi:beta-glucosidase